MSDPRLDPHHDARLSELISGLISEVADGVEPLGEHAGTDLARHAVDPHRPLAAARGVVHPGHEVPDDRLAVGRDAGAGTPLPRGVARVVAGRLVDQAARVERQRAALQRDEPGGPDRRLARPDVGVAVAADDLDGLARRLQDEIDRDLTVGDAYGAIGQHDPAAAQDRAARVRGRVDGATDKQAAYVVDRPITPADMAATVLTVLGVDPHTVLHTPVGRPIEVGAGGHAVTELL